MKKHNLIQATTYLAVLSLTLNGCEFMGPQQKPKLLLTQPLTNDIDHQGVIYEQLDNKPLTDEKDKLKTEIYPGGGLPVSELAARRSPSSEGGPGTYSLNFDEADLGEVAKVIISDILGQNYVLSPKVAGKVTLQTTKPLSKEQLMPTLEMLLRMNNAALVKDGGVYHIEPAGEALMTSSLSLAGGAKTLPSGYQVKVYPIRNVDVANMGEILKPLVGEKTILHSDATRNLLVVGGTAAELERVQEIVSIFDADIMRGRSFAMFPLSHVDPPTLVEELDQIFNKIGKEDESSFFRFIPIERMNAILAITHQSRYLTDIENWIIRLDRSKKASGGGVNVYKVQHVNALDLAMVLSDIYGSASVQSRGGQVAAGRKSVEVTNRPASTSSSSRNRSQSTSNQSQIQQVQRTSPGLGNLSGGAGGSNTNVKVAGVGEVKIIPDEINNSLVIVATAQEYSVIKDVIKQLDVMPLQVLIDATIVEVTLTDELEYGIQWYFSEGSSGIGSGSVSSNSNSAVALSNAAATAAAAAATGGLSAIYSSGAIKALLKAQANDGNINVISSPSLMVLNNQEANIQVGEEKSLRTSESTPLSGGAGEDNALIQTTQIQQRKTGVMVTVKPRVNANGLVTMEIEQSVESFGNSSTNGNPDILTREIASSVAVQSGETIVLGGLIQERTTSSQSGIPFLHDLPLIGPLFGSTVKNNDKTELVLLLTPRVVTNRQDARLVTDEFKRKLTGIYQDVPLEVEVLQ
ncbi:type II secretion system secretin GspD [Methylicorpusculum oleiharenae]|uniref:type II secretion system secretin GspD n=1 Tax=Methylicorpusculum oleiharenae TaxID=1338687 RepID=UPI0013572F68|nr:type II secretion system secretin GspD [Methylicorpusculum oleiharenae]MCD2449129.1 type II secretion system secretin GspD [Methylicorpusculum oleiharenae]